MQYHFTGVALVTGAASGIGRATALAFAKEGCLSIAIADMNDQKLREVEDAILKTSPNAHVLAVALDVSDEEAVNSFVERVKQTFSRLDYCCNIAGIYEMGSTHDGPISSMHRMVEVNLKGTYLCERAELQIMVNQEPLENSNSPYPARGSIVNVSSLAGINPAPDSSAYSATKHAVVGLSRSDGIKYGRYSIRVNAVCPGPIKTPGMLNESKSGGADLSKMLSQMAMGRFGDPEEIAECILWLCSTRSSFVTGTALDASGGRFR